ncbi:MAG: hypothetical protein KDK23_07495 [Leptospiraceae bacterium]|nr:hypothetical protein [Leptospiraceae bacterium]
MRLKAICTPLLGGIVLFGNCSVAQAPCQSTDLSCDDGTRALYFQPVPLMVVGGNNGTLWISRNGGASFYPIVPASATASYISVLITPDNRILASGNDGAGNSYIVRSNTFDRDWQVVYLNGGGDVMNLRVNPAGGFAAVRSNASTQAELLYSEDGLQWNNTAVSVVGSVASLHDLNGTLYVGMQSVADFFVRVDSGPAFTPSINLPGGDTGTGAIHGAGLSVVIGLSSNDVYYRPEGGSTWNTSPLGPSLSGCEDAAYGNGLFLVACPGNDELGVSFDGISYSRALPTGVDLTSVASSVQEMKFREGTFFISGFTTGAPDTARMARSLDGASWEMILLESNARAFSMDFKTSFQFLVPD